MSSVNTLWTARRRRPSMIACAAAALALVSSTAFAQEPPAVKIDDVIRDAVARFRQAPPGTSASPPVQSTAGGAPRPISLDQATQLALERNLNIAAQRLDAQTFDIAVAGARTVYRPTVSALIGDVHQTAVPSTLLTGGALVSTNTGTFNGEFIQNMTRGGGNLLVAWNNNRVASNSFFSNYDPAYNATLAAQYTQPLMRGLKFDGARHQITVTSLNRGMSELQVKATIANILVAVRNAYWDLVLAVQSIDVSQASVDTSNKLVDEDRKRVQAGTMTALDLITAESQAATDAHLLVISQGNARSAELALKRLLATSADDPLWQQTLVPTEQPDDRPTTIDLEASLRRAINERTDVAQAKQQTAANDATVKYLRDQIRPQADLVARYAAAGLGGSQVIRGTGDTVSPFNAPVIGTTSGTYFGALSSMGTGNYPTWSVAINITYPVGYSAARAEAARAEIQAKQAATQTRQLEVEVVNEVTAAAIEVRNAFDEIASARQASDTAARRLDAEQKKFAVGLSTNYLVVEAQRDLGNARRAVLRAEIAYQKARVEFDRAQQTTLQDAGVTIVAPMGFGAVPIGSGHPSQPAPSGSFF